MSSPEAEFGGPIYQGTRWRFVDSRPITFLREAPDEAGRDASFGYSAVVSIITTHPFSVGNRKAGAFDAVRSLRNRLSFRPVRL